MRNNKLNIDCINKWLHKIYIVKKKKNIHVARLTIISRKIVSKQYHEFVKEFHWTCQKYFPINKYLKEYNNQILKLYLKFYELIDQRFGDLRKEDIWLSIIKYFKYINKILCLIQHIKKLLVKNNLIVKDIKRKTKKAMI